MPWNEAVEGERIEFDNDDPNWKVEECGVGGQWPFDYRLLFDRLNDGGQISSLFTVV